MKIAFIATCLEPERDGVGDYSRLLAEECTRQGYPCCLISLNDRFINNPSQGTIREGEIKMPILRLPSKISWKKRIGLARKFLISFQPDWVSLQFVCYGYNSKGIVFGLRKRLKELLQDFKIHIMFHELWIGEYLEAKFKDKIVGGIQRFFILNLVKDLKPKVRHTHTRAYIAILKKYDILAHYLPLFGNIPVTTQNGNDWLFPRLKEKGLDISVEDRSRFWLFGFFGALHPTWPPEPLFSYLRQAALKQGCKIGIISIGDLRGGEKLWNKLCEKYSSDFVFLKLGYQPAERISRILNSIDFGIAIAPYVLIGKSGSIAAVSEHGVPVIVNSDDVHFREFSETSQKTAPLIYKMNENLPKRIKGIKREIARSGLPDAMKIFVRDLDAQDKF